jgi:phosphonate transport system permease protein
MSVNNFDVQTKIGHPWKKPPFIQAKLLRWIIIFGIIAYLIAAYMTIDVNWSRVYEGLERGKKFVLAFTNPDFTSRSSDIWSGMIESIIMTVASSIVGIGISIPIALGAARNVSPLPVYLICRGIIAISRALQEIIVAILLVAIFGFGPLAGFLTLTQRPDPRYRGLLSSRVVVLRSSCRHSRTHNLPMVYRICTGTHSPRGPPSLRLRPYSWCQTS